MWKPDKVVREAPFGNDYSSPVGVKIKQSKLVEILDSDQNSPTKDALNNSVEDLATPRSICKGSRNTNISSDSPLFGEKHTFNSGFINVDVSAMNTQAPNVFSKQQVLPEIPQANGFAHQTHHQIKPTMNLKGLLLNSGNLSENEEIELIHELQAILSVTSESRLGAIWKEIEQYDPYGNGVADSSSVKRVLLDHFKHVPVHERTWQQILRLFARNPQKPREVRYRDMLAYFSRILKAMDKINTQNATQTSENSVFAERGDAKLVLDIELCLKSAGADKIDREKLSSAFGVADRRNSGALTRREVESVLRIFHLFAPLQPVLDRLLARCQTDSGQHYNWKVMVHILGKAQPMDYAGDCRSPYSRGVPRHRRDMQSSFELSSPTGSAPFSPTPPAQTLHSPPPGVQSANYTSVAPPTQNGPKIESRSEKEQRLALLQEQIKKLVAEAEKLKKELGLEQREPTPKRSSPLFSSGASGSTVIQRLLEALEKLDHNNSGWIPQLKARQVIQQYNDLHQLGLNPRFIQSVIMLTSDETDSLVSVNSLSQYLRKAAE